jgi:molybdenum cofactor cytidylyltransferase
MNLAHALDVRSGQSLAFVGAGGKTSSMFALARDLKPPVVLTTTTHLGAWQAKMADIHQVVRKPKQIYRLDFEQPGILLLTGSGGVDGRLSGLDQITLKALHSICQQQGIPLLIEADGAKQRSLKAPAVQEPNIPGWVDQVVVVAGLNGLGQALDEHTVHRPKIFSKVAGLGLGEVIRVQNMVAVLTSIEGGLKGIPEHSQKTLLLNQAEGQLIKSKANRIASSLIDCYDRILVGSLCQTKPAGPVFSVHSRTAGVILAAGASKRLGHPKQLLSWQGKSYVYNVVLKAIAAGLEPLIVITGADRALVEEAVGDLPVQFIHNPNWPTGQSTSMKVGLAGLSQRCDSVVFLLSDQPQISPLLIRGLIERYAENRAPVTAPLAGGQRGNPVLFGRQVFQALRAVEGDQGGRAILKRFEVDWLPWVDERVLMDVDAKGDAVKLEQAYFSDL